MPTGVYSRVGRYGTAIDRFEQQINRTLTCWVWTGSVGTDGYAKFFVDGRTIHAHRWFWMHLHGWLPISVHVLHTCDNPVCVNPAHLWEGTHRANMTDKVTKNRQARGSRNGRAKLNEEIVAILRQKHKAARIPFSESALQYEVSETAIRKAVQGKSYARL